MEQGDGPSPAVRLWVPTSRKPASPREGSPCCSRSYEQGWGGGGSSQLHGSREQGQGLDSWWEGCWPHC